MSVEVNSHDSPPEALQPLLVHAQAQVFLGLGVAHVVPIPDHVSQP